MYKKDFIAWELSDEFDMEGLRELFNLSLPFSHQEDEQKVHASNRLFYLVMQSAQKHGLVGPRGIKSIRKDMSMEELLFDILNLASPIELIPSDLNYYCSTPPAWSASFKSEVVLSLAAKNPRERKYPEIVWVVDNDASPTRMICRILYYFQSKTKFESQNMFEIPIVKNTEGFLELSFKNLMKKFLRGGKAL